MIGNVNKAVRVKNLTITATSGFASDFATATGQTGLLVDPRTTSSSSATNRWDITTPSSRVLVSITGQALVDTRRLLSAGANVVRSTLDPVLGIARDLTKVSGNVFRIAAAIKDLPQGIKMSFMEVGAAFVNAYCLLKNSLGRGGLMPSYTRLFGSSSCSSTSGGRPLSPYISTNVFPMLHPAAASPVSMSAAFS